MSHGAAKRTRKEFATTVEEANRIGRQGIQADKGLNALTPDNDRCLWLLVVGVSQSGHYLCHRSI